MLIKSLVLAAAAFAGCSAVAAAAPPPTPMVWGGATPHLVKVARRPARAMRPSGRTRICVGPARFEIGSGQPTRLIFGGEGCSGAMFDVFAIKRLPPQTAKPSVLINRLAS
ncbi:MAG: hypothetical protein MI723_19080 [Caulobacterales bacterium]|nr:hypothetical protein [Caulobacterales bacterium]